MRRSITRAISILTAVLLTAGSVCTDVYAAGEDRSFLREDAAEDADFIVIDDSGEAEEPAYIADSGDIDEPAEADDSDPTEQDTLSDADEYDFEGGGYREIPGKGYTAELDDNITYLDIQNELIDGDASIAANYASPEAADSSPYAAAYPYSHTEPEQLADYLTTHYPTTRDQGSEGSCWAHSAIGLSEFYMISHDMTEMTDPGIDVTQLDYSELHLAYWAYAQGTPSLAGGTGDSVQFTPWIDNKGNTVRIIGEGGNYYFAAQTLMQRRGVAQETVAPYDDTHIGLASGEGLDPSCERDNVLYLKNAYVINPDNRTLAKEAIMSNGAVGISFWAAGTYCNSETSAYYSNITKKTNHAVMVVGWDDDYPRENFKESLRPASDGAWLVRNSWTTDAYINDYDSYFWMSYEEMSIDGYWVFEMMDLGDADFDNSYFYDSQIHNWDDMKAPKSANIYTASSGAEKETLQAVTFNTESTYSNLGYKIEVYTDIADPAKGPESGTIVSEATTEGIIAIGGMYTIALNQPVVLDNGENFSIVVTLSNGRSVSYEKNFNSWNGLDAGVMAGPKQSWMYTGGKWTDWGKAEGSNLVIHALTADGIRTESVQISEPAISFGNEDSVLDTVPLSATVTDGEGEPVSGSVIVWSSTDTDVCKVDQTGLVSVTGNGHAQIIASHRGFRGICDVTSDLKIWETELNANGGHFEYTDPGGRVTYPAKLVCEVYNGGTLDIEAPERIRYSFSGWTDASDPGAAVPEDMKIYEDHSFAAVWTPLETVKQVVILNSQGEEPDGEVFVGDRLIFRTETDEATIYYTLDGSDPADPEADRFIYNGLYTVTDEYEDLVIRAYAAKTDFADSPETRFEAAVHYSPEREWGDIINDDKAQCGVDVNGLPVNIPAGFWIADASFETDVTYTGSPVIFEGLRVYRGNKMLTPGSDYTVTYTNNKGITTSKKPSYFKVNFKGSYKGSIKKNIRIARADIAGATPDEIEDAYTGRALKISPAVMWNDRLLKAGTDYRMICYNGGETFDPENPGEPLKSVTSAGDYIIRLSGIGFFNGKKDIQLKVLDRIPMSSVQITGFASVLSFSGDPAQDSVVQPMASGDTPGLRLVYNGTELSEGTGEDDDYTVSYINNDRAGTATMYITGRGDYAGTVSKRFKINAIPISKAVIQDGTFAATVSPDIDIITSRKTTQDPVLTYGSYTLTEGTDYKLTYKNNTKPGTATMTVKGLGRYSGSFKKKFKISAYALGSDTADKIRITNIGDTSYSGLTVNAAKGTIGTVLYTAGGARPRLQITFDGIDLVEGRDYKISCSNNKKQYVDYYDPTKTYGRHPSVKVSGKGFFAGSFTCPFDMENNLLNNTAVKVTVSDKARGTKKNSLISVPVLKDRVTGTVLKAGRDYSKTVIYTYETDTVLSNGCIRRKGDTVKSTDVIMAGTDTVIRATMQGRINCGMYDSWRYCTLKNSYMDDEDDPVSVTYRVRSGVISKAKVKVHGGKAYSYTGGPIEPGKNAITVTVGGKKLKNTDYEIVSYSNNINCGTAKITIKGVGRYCGTRTVTFKIVRTG